MGWVSGGEVGAARVPCTSVPAPALSQPVAAPLQHISTPLLTLSSLPPLVTYRSHGAAAATAAPCPAPIHTWVGVGVATRDGWAMVMARSSFNTSVWQMQQGKHTHTHAGARPLIRPPFLQPCSTGLHLKGIIGVLGGYDVVPRLPVQLWQQLPRLRAVPSAGQRAAWGTST